MASAASDPTLFPVTIGRGELLAELSRRNADSSVAVDGWCWRHLHITLGRYVAVVAWPCIAQGTLTEIHVQLHNRSRAAQHVAAVPVAVAAAAFARTFRPYTVHIYFLALKYLVPDLAFGKWRTAATAMPG